MFLIKHNSFCLSNQKREFTPFPYFPCIYFDFLFSPRIQKSEGINTQTYRRCNLKMHRDEKKRKRKQEYFNKECSILSIFVMGNKCRLRKHFLRTICANKTVVGLKTHAKKWTIAHYSLAKIITCIGIGLASSSHSKGHAFSNSFCSLRHSSNSFVW